MTFIYFVRLFPSSVHSPIIASFGPPGLVSSIGGALQAALAEVRVQVPCRPEYRKSFRYCEEHVILVLHSAVQYMTFMYSV